MLLEDFEYAVNNNQYEKAAQMLVETLQGIDASYGALPNDFAVQSIHAMSAEELNANAINRLAAAIGSLLVKDEFEFDEEWKQRVFILHRWLAAIFAASTNRSGDAYVRSLLLHSLSEAEELDVTPFQLNYAKAHKFAMLFTQESEIPIEMEAVWSVDPATALNLGIALLSSRFAASELAHAKRETLLGWMPEKLREHGSLDGLAGGILHDVFMYCSYADREDKHEIKSAINELVRKSLLSGDISDLAISDSSKKNKKGKDKPVLFVMLEWFNSDHFMYRTHSEGLRSLKKHFHTVGFGFEVAADETAREVFDEFCVLPPANGLLEQVAFVREQAKERAPEVILYPSIGMFPLTICLANLRLAPIQVTTLGHGASSMAACVDYFAVESDFVGDSALFSEEILPLPKDALPLVRNTAFPKDLQVDLHKAPPPVVKVAITATALQNNPNFLRACQRIVDKCSYPVELHFFCGLSVGLIHKQLAQTIKSYIPAAQVYPNLAYPDYIEALKGCDLFLNPFPYGNMSGIADMLELHMLGVCLTGPQVHQKIDQAMFERVGFPKWTVAKTHDEYVAAACKLIENHDLRHELRKALKDSGVAKILYKGRSEILSEKLLALSEKRK